MSADSRGLKEKVFAVIASVAEDRALTISDSTALIGDGAVLDSMKLVELCLQLEDMAGEIGFEFDWTSEAAMSKSRGMFRTAGALTDEFIRQQSASK